MEKSDRKSNCCGEQRKIEHPPLFCQSVSSVKHCSVCCLPHGVQGPFYLTWLCKRFSQRPKGGECQQLDKVPRLPDGPCWTEGETGRGAKGESSPKECQLNTGGRVVGVLWEGSVYVCLPVPFFYLTYILCWSFFSVLVICVLIVFCAFFTSLALCNFTLVLPPLSTLVLSSLYPSLRAQSSFSPAQKSYNRQPCSLQSFNKSAQVYSVSKKHLPLCLCLLQGAKYQQRISAQVEGTPVIIS